MRRPHLGGPCSFGNLCRRGDPLRHSHTHHDAAGCHGDDGCAGAQAAHVHMMRVAPYDHQPKAQKSHASNVSTSTVRTRRARGVNLQRSRHASMSSEMRRIRALIGRLRLPAGTSSSAPPGCGHKKGPPAHPPELTYPCCLPALGEFSEMTPHEGSAHRLPQARVSTNSGLGRARRAGCAGAGAVVRRRFGDWAEVGYPR